MLVEFEGDMPSPCVIAQFVESNDKFLARVEEFVRIHKERIERVVRVEDESGKVDALIESLFEELGLMR